MGAEFIFCSLCFGLDFQTKRQNQGPNLCYPLTTTNKKFKIRTSILENVSINTNGTDLRQVYNLKDFNFGPKKDRI